MHCVHAISLGSARISPLEILVPTAHILITFPRGSYDHSTPVNLAGPGLMYIAQNHINPLSQGRLNLDSEVFADSRRGVGRELDCPFFFVDLWALIHLLCPALLFSACFSFSHVYLDSDTKLDSSL